MRKLRNPVTTKLQHYLMFIAGAVFFVGRLLATIYSEDNLGWFIFLP